MGVAGLGLPGCALKKAPNPASSISAFRHPKDFIDGQPPFPLLSTDVSTCTLAMWFVSTHAVRLSSVDRDLQHVPQHGQGPSGCSPRVQGLDSPSPSHIPFSLHRFGELGHGLTVPSPGHGRCRSGRSPSGPTLRPSCRSDSSSIQSHTKQTSPGGACVLRSPFLSRYSCRYG